MRHWPLGDKAWGFVVCGISEQNMFYKSIPREQDVAKLRGELTSLGVVLGHGFQILLDIRITWGKWLRNTPPQVLPPGLANSVVNYYICRHF